MSIYLSVTDAVEVTGLCRGTIYNYIRAQKIVSRKFGGKHLILASSLGFGGHSAAESTNDRPDGDPTAAASGEAA